ncbi:MAG: metalloregulator ArsR/SmtB family transcription factor [Acholeplasmataceae bacterium]|jgi:DNA-binding transcriptional ArsR family regulator|nr:metalloregulator ArsR/SmtB family transcription factor [Acholeplasmataceae bacterium]
MKSCGLNCQCQIFHQETLDRVKEQLYSDQMFEQMSILFKIFQDPSRLKILEAIKDEQLCVCDLAALLGVSKSAISHQMRFLKRYELVTSTKEGKMVYYRLLNHDVKHMITHANHLLKGINSHAQID